MGRPRKSPATRPDSRPRMYRGLPPEPVVCPGCDKVFTPLHGGVRYCSNACRQAVYRLRKRRRDRRRRAESPPPFEPDAVKLAHLEAAERHLESANSIEGDAR